MIVFINVFHVDQPNQQRLVDILTKVTGELVSKAPGFVSSILYRSTDGSKVTMYARWASLADYEAMRQDPAPRPYLEEALSFAQFDPAMYEVVSEFHPKICGPENLDPLRLEGLVLGPERTPAGEPDCESGGAPHKVRHFEE